MANQVVLDTVNSTLTLNGRTIEDTPEGDVFVISYQNNVTNQTQGVSGGVVIKPTVNKDSALITVRVLRDRSDDAWFTNQINQEPIVSLAGSLKTNFTRDGVDGVETYTITGGSIQTRSDHTINNTDGEEVSEYILLVSNAVRSL